MQHEISLRWRYTSKGHKDILASKANNKDIHTYTQRNMYKPYMQERTEGSCPSLSEGVLSI